MSLSYTFISFVASIAAISWAYFSSVVYQTPISPLEYLLVGFSLFSVYQLNNFSVLKNYSRQFLLLCTASLVIILYLKLVSPLKFLVLSIWTLLSLSHLLYLKSHQTLILKPLSTAIAWSLIPVFCGLINPLFSAYILLRVFAGAIVCDAIDIKEDKLLARNSWAMVQLEKGQFKLTLFILLALSFINIYFMEMRGVLLLSLLYSLIPLIWLLKNNFRVRKTSHILIDLEYILPSLVIYFALG